MDSIEIEDCVRLAKDGSLLVGALGAVHRIDPRTGKSSRWLATPGGAGPIEMSPDRTTAFVGDGKRSTSCRSRRSPKQPRRCR